MQQENEFKISETIDEMQERYLIKALERTGGKANKAAELLGVTERTIYSMKKKYKELEAKRVDN